MKYGSSKNPCLLNPHLIFISSVLHYDQTKPISATIPWGIKKPVLLCICLDLNKHILGDMKEKKCLSDSACKNTAHSNSELKVLINDVKALSFGI